MHASAKLRLRSPAKVNLFLKCLRKRDDGFTDIISFFQAIDLFDIISIELSSKDRFTSSDLSLQNSKSNTVTQSLNLFRSKTQLDFYVHIHLKKNIPAMAGLGGGSGNAATVLWALNKLTNSNLSDTQLSQWGAEIGSDIPFFFSNGQALVRGRGEIIEPCDRKQKFSAWIAKPNFGLSTKDVYKAFEFSADEPFSVPSSDNLIFFNDLEIPAFKLAPNLQQIRNGLQKLGFSQVVMTGSGTAFFCIGDVVSPQYPGILFYQVKDTYRSSSTWY